MTGKIGTDIVEGKCTWLVLAALTEADPGQRAALHEDYGRGEGDAAAEARVKELYRVNGSSLVSFVFVWLTIARSGKIFRKIYWIHIHYSTFLFSFQTLGVPEIYKSFEISSYKSLISHIDSLPDPLNHEVFHKFLSVIHKRTS